MLNLLLNKNGLYEYVAYYLLTRVIDWVNFYWYLN